MKKPVSAIPTTPSAETLCLLEQAIAELREFPNELIISSRFERSHDVADHLEKLTNRLIDGDVEAGRELLTAFCATSDWDDACGSHELGNRLVLALMPYRPSTR